MLLNLVVFFFYFTSHVIHLCLYNRFLANNIIRFQKAKFIKVGTFGLINLLCSSIYSQHS